MKNILVAIEFNNKDNLLIEKATELAQKFDSKVWITHVAMPPPDFVGEKAGPRYVRDIRGNELRGEHKEIQLFADGLKLKGIDAEALLVQGMTVETIIEESIKLNADLIIIGIHEHNALHKVFIGSQASKIINRSKVPVLVVPVE